MPRRAAPFLLAAALLPAGCGGGAASVSVFPLDGTRTASATTEIAFRGASRHDLGGVRVEGERSGRHPGHRRAHPDGHGASFTPAQPFRPGERVTVSLDREVAGTNARRMRFTVAGPPSGRSGRVAPAPRGRLRGVQAF